MLGTAYGLKEYRFHQIIRLSGFKYRPALRGGERNWGWGDARCALPATVGQGDSLSTAAGDRQPDQDLFVLNSPGGSVYWRILEN